MTTVAQLIDQSRSRHSSLKEGNDGAAMAFLNQRLRVILLKIIEVAEAVVGTTSEIETEGTGTLIALDDLGMPYFATTTEPGYVIRFSGGVPYIDVGDPFVVDPFGEDGDVPGLPLPEDLLHLASVVGMTRDNPIVPRPVTVLQQEVAQQLPAWSGLRAFLSANRLVPMRQADNDLWSTVTSIRIGFVRCQELTALTDVITLPKPALGALEAALTEYFASGSEKCPEADKRRFERQAQAAMGEMVDAIQNLDGVTTNAVIYKR